MRGHPLCACAGLLPVFEEAQLARQVRKPVGHGFEERDFSGAVRSDFLNHPPLKFRALGFTSLMLDAVAASTKAAEMDEGAAGAVQQAANRAVEAIGVGRFDAANPVRIEQLVFVKRAIIRINIGPARHSLSRPSAIWIIQGRISPRREPSRRITERVSRQ